MSEPLMAQISAFGGNFAPKDWAFCHGQMKAISEYAAVYSLLGTYYGGDGRSRFGLPDLRGRSPLGYGAGQGTSPRNIGQYGGFERVTLTIPQMPVHTHRISNATLSGDVTCTLNARAVQGDESEAQGAMLADQGAKISSGTKIYTKDETDGIVALSDKAVTTAHDLSVSGGDIDPSGGGEPHENMHPWLCLNYIIALGGIYPSRPS